MARGGSRDGAGRKSGTPNRLTAENVAKAKASGELPLDYMLRVMRDDSSDTDRRDEMAKAAAPFLHAKLASMEHTGPGGGPVQFQRIERVIVDAAQPSPPDRDAEGLPAAAEASTVQGS